MKLSEHHIQGTYFDWVRVKRLQDWRYKLIWAVPNGGQRDLITANRLKREGVTKGVLDVTIAIPSQGFHGAFIEHKAANGTISPDQHAMLNLLSKAGYKVFVSYSTEESIIFTEKYLEERSSDGKENT